MNSIQHTQPIIDQLNAQLQKSTWTIEDSISILSTIQVQKEGILNFTDASFIGNIQAQCAEFIHDGIKAGNLHVIDKNSSSSNIRNIVSAAAGGLGLGTLLSGGSSALILAGSLNPLILTAGLVTVSLKYLPAARKKRSFLRSQLIPAEVAAYAKLHDKWLDNTDQPELAISTQLIAESGISNHQDSKNSGDICALPTSGSLPPEKFQEQTPDPSPLSDDTADGINLDLWKKSVTLVVGDWFEKYDAATTIKQKNGMYNGTKTWPFEIKVLYKSLQHIFKGCECINLALEKIILVDVENESADFSPEEKKALELINQTRVLNTIKNCSLPTQTSRLGIVKENVKLALYHGCEKSKTRVYKGNQFNPKWHDVNCNIHPAASNAAPKRGKQ